MLTTSRTRSPDPQPPAGRFFGRRQGRPLRAGRRRLLEELLPALRVPVPGPPGNGENQPGPGNGEHPNGVHLPGNGEGPHGNGENLDPPPIRLQDHFPPGLRAVWLEIGFGAGEHLAWQAGHHPGVGFLGCEIFVNGIASLLRHIDERGLANVRIADAEATALLQALPTASIGRAFLLFPDPWPKKRHHKRRFVRAASLTELARVLTDSAELRFATDHGPYARWTLALALAHPAFDWPASAPDDWRRRPADWPETRYEAAARSAGRVPCYFTFRRRPRSAE